MTARKAVFVDEVRLEVHGGNGGNGCKSFRREKYRPKGGPDGGDGGRGGSVALEVDAARSTLLDYHYRHQFKAESGAHGRGSDQHGRAGRDLVLPVPPGTLVRDEDGDVLGDLTRPGQRLVIAAGGVGGRGNIHFVTSTRRAPAFAEKGEPGHERGVVLELKLLADIGLVGHPNAGKSTLISAVSAAKPKVASYPFTTLTPHLGVVGAGQTSFVMADVPGLIEGAHEGAGLGHDFLRHIERCSALVIVIDASGIDGREPLEDYRMVLEELKAHDPALAARPRLVACNKMDLAEARTAYPGLEEALEEAGERVFAVSAAAHDGLDALVQACASLVEEVRGAREAAGEEGLDDDVPVYAAPKEVKTPLKVVRADDGAWEVSGGNVVRMVVMTDMDNEEAVAHLQARLLDAGVEQKLTVAGAKEGDTVRMGAVEFDFMPVGAADAEDEMEES